MSSQKFQQAQALIQSGNFEQARSVCLEICSEQPNDPNAWILLATTHKHLGALQDAVSCCQKLIQLMPESVAAYYNLAIAKNQAGDGVGAEAAYRRAIDLDPSDGAVHFHLGCLLEQKGKLQDALREYKTALQHQPDLAGVHEAIARVQIARGDLDGAKSQLDGAIAADPSNIQLLISKGTALEEQGRYDEASECYLQALDKQPDSADLHVRIARVKLPSGDLHKVKAHYEKALQIDADNINAKAGLADVLEKKGHHERAYRIIAPLIEEDPNNLFAVLVFSTLCSQANRCDKAIELLKGCLDNPGLSNRHRRSIHFALGRLLIKSGDAVGSFEHYTKGNDLKITSFNEWDFARNVDSLIRIFSKGQLQQMPGSRITSKNRRPIFIVGIPRSGTSLTEQILATHPDVHAAGELTYILEITDSLPKTLNTEQLYPDCIPMLNQEHLDTLCKHYMKKMDKLNISGKKWMTDKQPVNFLNLGFIELLLPNARIIHCKREPLDNCLSCYFTDFGAKLDFTYDLTKLGAFYHQYERLMEHWMSVLSIPVFDIQYEETVGNPEETVAALLKFCGLRWNEKCLKFYNNPRRVNTASYNQVRRPLYKSSIGRWKPYSDFLDPLRRALTRDI